MKLILRFLAGMLVTTTGFSRENIPASRAIKVAGLQMGVTNDITQPTRRNLERYSSLIDEIEGSSRECVLRLIGEGANGGGQLVRFY
jgi:hypothetical protein